eukprot:g2978.t1
MGILELIWVARPGGWVLLRHARNEGVAGHFQLGLHQWAFDVEDRADGRHFVIWSPSLRVDVSDWLLSSGLAAEVKAERRPHPAGGEEELPGTADGLVQKHYLHAVLSDRVARGARINLTWRWVVKHDRDCIRRRDRASTVPIKLGRQAREILRKDRKGSLIWSLHCEASEKKAALKAAARSAAAAVQSSALQNAAASAESARLSRPASAGAREGLYLAAAQELSAAQKDAYAESKTLPLQTGARDGRGTSSDKRRPEQEGRERLSDLVTKGAQAIDEAKRRSDPRVRNALDIGSQHSERQDQSVGSLLDSLAKPRGKYPKDVSEEPKQDQNRHSHERIEVHTNAREQSSQGPNLGQLVLKPRGLRPVTVYSAADCQQQDRSRGQLPKEDDRGRESPREVSSIDAEIYQKVCILEVECCCWVLGFLARPIHLASIRTEKRRPEKRTPEKAPRELSWTNILKEIMKGRRLDWAFVRHLTASTTRVKSAFGLPSHATGPCIHRPSDLSSGCPCRRSNCQFERPHRDLPEKCSVRTAFTRRSKVTSPRSVEVKKQKPKGAEGWSSECPEGRAGQSPHRLD